MSQIDLIDISMVYRTGRQEVVALDGITMSVRDGEFACIVGSSGCGKSTLLLIAAGLLRPTTGEVRVGGRLEFEPGADRGMVFQTYSLYPWLSVRRNIEFGLELKGMPAAERRRISDELIRLMGLEGFADAYPKALSGGMRQRVAIARALANDPEVLLMDEPFGALDAQTRQLMQELLMDIWQRYRKTVLFVTHDIEEAVFLADTIYIMTSRPGRIRTVIPVDLPRPRTFDTLASDEFNRLRREVLKIIHEESLRAAQYELAQSPQAAG
jgi:NitT/TauT family transport system ATP-binding protein